MRYINTTFLTGIFAALATSANADIINITTGSDSFDLHSNSNDSLFSDSSGIFSSTDLATIHTMLNAWGVQTEGFITILPMNTNAGLSLLTLIDQELGFGDTDVDASISLSSTAPSSLGMYINDYEQDVWTLIDPPFGSQTMGAVFVWGGSGSGDAFAWTGLSIGDALSYSFTDNGALGDPLNAETFQFVGWTDSGWDVVSSNGFKNDGSSVFTGMVIPAPPVGIVLFTFAIGYRNRRH
ncbi:MAG: hypothetical protein VX436_01035 [Planctomycetota bacterium]|nr:hypothetical protein [Planctomycetota bacterium]